VYIFIQKVMFEF